MVGTYNMVILQGSDKTISLTIKDSASSVVDLTGYTAGMHVRRNVRSDVLLDSLHSSTDRISITPLEGKIDLVFPNEVTSAYDFTKAVYDLELYSGVIVARILEGTFTVSPEVTRQ
jgi:hypothetical protein